ncbi:hypothetical protein NPIL_113931 [Nephila pilipes]|uniref:Uncharacterized protein n=1 Tax=Nephila pilipes TaxID=299642 RepID=A0A8X6QDH1_NEPPI|nr:hypothetical protein NPIL_113931 [Nephila pilipes]
MVLSAYDCGSDLEAGEDLEANVERPNERQYGILAWCTIAYDFRSPLLYVKRTIMAQRNIVDMLFRACLGLPKNLFRCVQPDHRLCQFTITHQLLDILRRSNLSMTIQVIDMINALDYEVRSPAGIIWYLCGYECPCSYGYRPHLTGTPFIVVQLQKHVRRLTVMVTLSRERAFSEYY